MRCSVDDFYSSHHPFERPPKILADEYVSLINVLYECDNHKTSKTILQYLDSCSSVHTAMFTIALSRQESNCFKLFLEPLLEIHSGSKRYAFETLLSKLAICLIQDDNIDNFALLVTWYAKKMLFISASGPWARVLYAAVESGKENFVSFLLNNTFICFNDEFTFEIGKKTSFLFLAVERKYESIIILLKSKGASNRCSYVDEKATKKNIDALKLAIDQKDTKIIQLLIDSKMEFIEAMKLATQIGSIKLINFLLNYNNWIVEDPILKKRLFGIVYFSCS